MTKTSLRYACSRLRRGFGGQAAGEGRAKEAFFSSPGLSPKMAAMAQDDRIRGHLTAALQAQRRGDMAAAEAACGEALALDPAQPDALQFLGLIAAEKGDLEAARGLMEQSLHANPNQPHVLNNLGNVLRRLGALDKAAEHLKKATGLKADYREAWLNLAVVELERGEPEAAEKALAAARALGAGDDPRAETLAGNIAKAKGDTEAARARFRAALKIKPDSVPALHNLGLLHKEAGRLDEAWSCYQAAHRINSQIPELLYNMGNVRYEQGEIDEAVEYYARALDTRPDYLEAHRTLNEILWRHGRHQGYLKSYEQAIEKAPGARDLYLKYAEALLNRGRAEEAEAVAGRGLGALGEEPWLSSLQGRALAAQGELDDARRRFEQSVALAAAEPSLKLAFAKFLIPAGEVERALRELEETRELAPLDQEIIAHQGLCWQLLGDPRAAWLNDYDAFVKAYTIPVPEGFRTLAAFNARLDKVLDRYHTSLVQPSDQTLRGGTQSKARLIYEKVPEIQALRRSFEAVIARYIDALPDDPEHPLLSRKSRKFTFSGSWSVRLKAEGFHVNHVHSDGWISSSYYVAVPDEIAKGKGKEGWIKFGESPFALDGKEKIGKEVRPRAGLLVLFPSYTFHGTYPFKSARHRTTFPFDAVPAKE